MAQNHNSTYNGHNTIREVPIVKQRGAGKF